ncbi:MAG: isoamylase early set domain-containing protein [Ferruginibacter sp.]
MKTNVSFILTKSKAQQASRIWIIGDFNHWDMAAGFEMQPMEDGSFFAEIPLEAGKTVQYRYLLDNNQWVNDDRPTVQTEAYGHMVENCIITVPRTRKKSIYPLAVVTDGLGQSLTERPIRKSRIKQTGKDEVAPSSKDDLTNILGIRRKTADFLKKEGIGSFKELGRCTMKKLLLILNEAGLRKTARHYTSWSKQAKLAAAGDWQGLAALQASLEKTSKPVDA